MTKIYITFFHIHLFMNNIFMSSIDSKHIFLYFITLKKILYPLLLYSKNDFLMMINRLKFNKLFENKILMRNFL